MRVGRLGGAGCGYGFGGVGDGHGGGGGRTCEGDADGGGAGGVEDGVAEVEEGAGHGAFAGPVELREGGVHFTGVDFCVGVDFDLVGWGVAEDVGSYQSGLLLGREGDGDVEIDAGERLKEFEYGE